MQLALAIIIETLRNELFTLSVQGPLQFRAQFNIRLIKMMISVMASFFQEIDGIMILRNNINMNKKHFTEMKKEGERNILFLMGTKVSS